MAISFETNSNSGYQAASDDYNFARTVNAGNNRFLLVSISIIDTFASVTAVTDDYDGTPASLTFIGSGGSASPAFIVEHWILVAPATGTKNIRVQLSASTYSVAFAVAYSNVDQVSPTAHVTSAHGHNELGADDATVDIITTTTGSWAVAALSTIDQNVTANQTARDEVSGTIGCGAIEDTGIAVAPGTTTMSYTDIGALFTWAIVGFELRVSPPVDILMGQAWM